MTIIQAGTQAAAAASRSVSLAPAVGLRPGIMITRPSLPVLVTRAVHESKSLAWAELLPPGPAQVNLKCHSHCHGHSESVTVSHGDRLRVGPGRASGLELECQRQRVTQAHCDGPTARSAREARFPQSRAAVTTVLSLSPGNACGAFANQVLAIAILVAAIQDNIAINWNSYQYYNTNNSNENIVIYVAIYVDCNTNSNTDETDSNTDSNNDNTDCIASSLQYRLQYM